MIRARPLFWQLSSIAANGAQCWSLIRAIEWTSAEEAVRGVRDLGYASPNMLGYFPRMLKRRSDDIARPAGGAIAGLLCKQDRTYGPWQGLEQQGMGLHRHLLPAVDIDDEDAHLLNRAGLNVIAMGRQVDAASVDR